MRRCPRESEGIFIGLTRKEMIAWLKANYPKSENCGPESRVVKKLERL
jgi:hypothetical protein